MSIGWAATIGGLDDVEDGMDVSLGIRELGSIYLGGTSLTALHRAGRVTERTPGAVAAMTMAFEWPQLPYCPDDF